MPAKGQEEEEVVVRYNPQNLINASTTTPYEALGEQYLVHVDQMHVQMVDTGQSARTIEADAEATVPQLGQQR